MRKRSTKPKAVGIGVSLPSDVLAAVDERIAKLRPRVKNFSHYVQILVDWDLRGNGDPKPFNDADTSHVSLAA